MAYHMKGFSGFGNSPIEQRPYVNIGSTEVYPEYAGSGVSISGGEGEKPLSTFTLTPGITAGNLNLAGKYKGGFKTTETGESTSKTFTGGTGKFSFGSRNPGTYSPSFKGSISGDYGTTKHPTGEKTKGFSGRLDLGIGRSGSFGCTGKGCSSPDIAGYHIKGFGEYSSKGSYNPGTRIGISGRYGVFHGEGSYDIQTQKPQFKFGIKIPINK